MRRIAEADWLAGASLVALARPDEALAFLRNGLNSGILQSAPQSKIVGDLYMARANALMWNFNVEPALRAVQAAYRIYGLTGDTRSQALALFNIGSIYAIARDDQQALRYYTQAIERFPGDRSLLMAAHFNRGRSLLQMGNSRAAAREYREAVNSALVLKSRLFAERYLGSLAYSELLSSNLEGAGDALQRGYALADRNDAAERRNSLDWVAAALALRQGHVAKATELIAGVFDHVNLGTTSLAQRDGLRVAYEVYKAAGQNATALTYLEAYKQADDKARSLAASASAALMSARFDYVNQQAQIRQLHVTQAAEAEAARAKLRTTIFNGLLIAFAIIVGLMLIAYLSIRRSRDQVRAANADLSQSNTALEKALAARTEFLAMTSHEIRTPLNGILGMTQVLLADRALDGGVRGKIELVHGAGETMKALVNDLLDVAKMTTGEIVIHKADMALDRLLHDAEQVWSGQAQSRGLALRLDAAGAPARIVEDEVRLRQIVFNLMSNAIKFTDHGDVALAATVIADGDGERLRIAVSDSGIGIPPDKQEEIFESFRQVDAGVTRRHGGTGLGLSICRSLARAMGGDVTVASAPGAGATFLVDLPLQRVAEAAPEPARQATATALVEAVLLAVEANPITQSVLRSVLGAQVAQVHVVAGAEEAARLLAGERIDLVLADGAALGLDLAAAGALAAAAAGAGARMVLLWPSPDATLHAAAQAAGIARVIGKPISPSDLVARLRTLYTGIGHEHLAA